MPGENGKKRFSYGKRGEGRRKKKGESSFARVRERVRNGIEKKRRSIWKGTTGGGKSGVL